MTSIERLAQAKGTHTIQERDVLGVFLKSLVMDGKFGCNPIMSLKSLKDRLVNAPKCVSVNNWLTKVFVDHTDAFVKKWWY